jgi:hypothetical protein
MTKRLITGAIAVLTTTLALLAGVGAPTASAATVCTGDVCVIVPDTLQTPLGLATITVSATNVVTVQFTPTTANTFVQGIPFSFPAGAKCSIPPGPPCFVETSLDTAGGLVSIDTFQIPPGPPVRFAPPNLAIISLHPPSPCRVQTIGTTVVFTPIV